jgi:hypothetical protein
MRPSFDHEAVFRSDQIRNTLWAREDITKHLDMIKLFAFELPRSVGSQAIFPFEQRKKLIVIQMDTNVKIAWPRMFSGRSNAKSFM